MAKFVIRRVLQAIPVLFGITVVVYGILLAAPGGPTAKFANNPRITDEQREKFKQAWGLDQPIPIQYCRWMGFCNPETTGTFLGSLPTPAAFLGPTGLPNFLPEMLSGATNGVLHGDFGYSINSGEKVSDRIVARRPPDVHPRGRRARRVAHDRHRPRRLRGHPPLLAVRQRGHGVLVRGPRHAHVLAGHHADLHLRGHAALAAGERDDGYPLLAAVRLRQVLGVLWREPARGPRRHRQAPDPAGDHAGRGQHRR